MIDALHFALSIISDEHLIEDHDFSREDRKILLVTTHRRENFGVGLENICDSLEELSKDKGLLVVLPVHPNPNVSKVIRRKLSNRENILLLNSLNYLQFVYLMNKSFLILTDSGGIQEEGPSLGKPVLVMRDTTERPEGVSAGTVIMVGTKPKSIIKCVKSFIEDDDLYRLTSVIKNPYGCGESSIQIEKVLIDQYAKRL